MKSPFPGMDPFIEACGLWEDFHHDLIAEIKAKLAASVSERYVVRTGERAYVVLADPEFPPQSHGFLPDVSVATRHPETNGGRASATATLAEPGTLNMRALVTLEFREAFVEILEATPERSLVVSIEVLSPSNKRQGTPGWELYQRKRQALLSGQAHLVEIDLLRGGQRMPMADPWPAFPYFMLIARRERAPMCKVWPGHFRKPLPNLPIPLLPPDLDVSLDLQPLIESVYARSRYYQDIDYARPLTPPLPAEDATWLNEKINGLASPG